VHDFFVYAPNALGLVSGLTQVGLIAKYGLPPKGDKDEDAQARKYEVPSITPQIFDSSKYML